jgi:kinetochore protein NNF1
MPSASSTSDAAQVQRSDSPPPPTALTPGPLAARLTELYHTALSHTLRACSYENFASCFPTPAKYRPEILKGLWMQVVGKIEEKGREEFEGILVEREVVQGLNTLEGVVEVGRGRREGGGVSAP